MQNQAAHPFSVNDKINLMLSTALGLGLSPFAPGTCGTLLGVFIHVAIVTLTPPPQHWLWLGVSFLLVCIIHNPVARWAIQYWKNDDPGHFVLDEVAGYLFVVALFHHGHLWQVAFWGFFLFRFFDIVKPPPAHFFDRKMKNAWGILLDDLSAGAYVVGVLYLFKWIGPIIGMDRWLIQP